MTQTLLKRFIRRLCVVGVVALGAAVAVAQSDGQIQKPAPGVPMAQASQRSDGQIEMDVVHALDASRALKNDLITAATIQGEVTLTGTVSSDASAELAESIAAHVPGVTKVNNNLKTGNPQDAQAAQAPDQLRSKWPRTSPTMLLSRLQQLRTARSPCRIQIRPGAGSGSKPGPATAPYPPARPQYAPPPAYYPHSGNMRRLRPTGTNLRCAQRPRHHSAGTLIQVRTNEGLASKHAKDGEPVQFTVIRDVAVGGVLALPKGATVHGVVTEVKKVGSAIWAEAPNWRSGSPPSTWVVKATPRFGSV